MIKTKGAGIHLTFPNGYTASIQWGPGTYSDNHDKMPSFGPHEDIKKSWDSTVKKCAEGGSKTVEVAALFNDSLIPLPERFGGGEVEGYLPTERIPEFLSWVAGR